MKKVTNWHMPTTLDPQSERLAKLIVPTLEALGFELVRLGMVGGDGTKTLQVMAERSDGTMSIDDCEEVSRALSALLDVEDPIEDNYRLEVSSPGVDRPLTRLKDFARWEGFEAKLELVLAVDGQKRFRGILAGVEGDEVLLDVEEHGTLGFAFSMIHKAKLVLTDALLAAAAEAAKGAKNTDGAQMDVVEKDEDNPAEVQGN